MSDVLSASTLKGVGGTFPPKQWMRLGAEWDKAGLKAQNFDAKPTQIQLTPAALIQRIEDLTPYLPTLAEMAGGE